MPISVWFGVKFTPGGHSTFFGFLNTFVHIIMYAYYLVAALGPQYQRYLWWKKYLTALQMVIMHSFLFLIPSESAFKKQKRTGNFGNDFENRSGKRKMLFCFLKFKFQKVPKFPELPKKNGACVILRTSHCI